MNLYGHTILVHFGIRHILASMTGCRTDSRLSFQNTNPHGTSTFRSKPLMTRDWCLNLPALHGSEPSKGHNNGGCCWRKEIPPQKADWVEGNTTPQKTLKLSEGELGRKLETPFSTRGTFQPRKPSVKLTLETQSHAISFPCSLKTPLSLPESLPGAPHKVSDVTTRPVCVWLHEPLTSEPSSSRGHTTPTHLQVLLLTSAQVFSKVATWYAKLRFVPVDTNLQASTGAEGLRIRAHSTPDYLWLETGRCESHCHTYKTRLAILPALWWRRGAEGVDGKLQAVVLHTQWLPEVMNNTLPTAPALLSALRRFRGSALKA